MELPLVTPFLALRLGQSETDHFVSWLQCLQRWDGNSFGVEIRQFGKAMALVNTGMTLGPLFNRVVGLGDADTGCLEEIVQFYGERGLGCRIDINPYDAGPALFDQLAACGLHPFRFHCHLYGLPQNFPVSEPADPAVTAREIRPEELDLWAQTWRAGYGETLGVTEAMADQIAEATKPLFREPGWGLYLAFADGQPAAAGALYVHSGVGSLVVGGTRPEFRRRGCQRVLLGARMADAAEHGCDLVAAQAGLGTTSQHNMERAGMRVAYTRAFWLRREAFI